MAEMVVAPVINVLAQLLIEEANWFKGVHREVKSLKDELESIRCFLKDAEERSEKGNVNDGVKTWVKQVREEAYHIEDVIDVYLLHASLCEIKKRGKRYGFDSVEQESSRGTATSEQDYDPRLGSLFVEDDEFFDVGLTREELMTRLVEGQSTRMVISLVGTGGIGKTTLVKKVYDNEVVKGHFDCCAWITVSQSYSLEKLLRTMMQEIHQATEYLVGETGTIIERLISALRIYLETKRLYRYWIAEGFVTEKRGKTLEQIAEEYLNELIQRNLVQVWGLANELGFCQILDEKSSKISGKARRLSIQGTEKAVETVDDYSTRSLLLFNDELPNAFMLTLFQKFKKFKLLKVLDLTGAPLSYLPKEVGNLFHLKFLSIKNTKVKVLPKFIGKLVNLEILDFLFTQISELPVEINKL
ncbi:hypothetical protein UlMin_003297 [Ulmus minor]